MAMILSPDVLRDTRAASGWVYVDEDYQYTTNSWIIQKELMRLKNERIWIEIRCGGYYSKPTLIRDVRPGGLEVERPRDWRSDSEILLTYRSASGPWHFLPVRVLRTAANSVWTTLPYALAVLERRGAFRVPVPPNSQILVHFTRRGKQQVIQGDVEDISLGGLAFWAEVSRDLPVPERHDMVGPIHLELQVIDSKPCPPLKLERAEVVRIEAPLKEADGRQRFSLKFKISEKDREFLWSCIHRQELALLKAASSESDEM
jgi:hypothetical protein